MKHALSKTHKLFRPQHRLLIGLVLLLATLAFIQRSDFAAANRIASAAKQPLGDASPKVNGVVRLNTAADFIPMALITIRPTGFDPAEISRASGRFMLAVDNKSGLDQVTVRLTNEGGQVIREVQLSPERRNWREKIILLPGNYLLTAGDHPNWRSRIAIAE